MKRSGIIIMAAVVALFGFNAYAFHSGGVAECEGCHSMHSPTSSSFLLVGSDQSSACLTCHDGPTLSSYHVSSVATATTGTPANRTPGGDFTWLKKTYTWSGGQSEGQAKGHNIIAEDFGYVADTRHAEGPGGSFPTSDLGCQSCHDPHGKARRLPDGSIVGTGAPIIGSGSYDTSTEPQAGQAVGVYRILYAGASPDQPQGATYTSNPIAVAPSSYNRTEASSLTRVAYGGGGDEDSWGNWCGTCHGEFNSGDKTVHHPIEVALGSTIAGKYNAYVKTGDLTGTRESAYNSLVPFAEATEDFAVLKTHAKNGTYLQGPSSSDTVTCLSCHRAHASGFDEMLRWYYTWEFMTFDGMYPGLDNPSMTSSRKPTQAGGRNMADFQAAYYDRPATVFSTYQRSLCNKCHTQD